MAQPIPRYLFCTYCEIDGHEVISCHHLFEALTSFAAAAGLTTGQSAQGSAASGNQKSYRVARWGGGKKKRFVNDAASGVPTQGTGHPSNYGTYLNLGEAQMLATYLEQQRLYWLWCRASWAYSAIDGLHRQPE